MIDINRIKVVLVEAKHTSKWMGEQLHKDHAGMSKWCANSTQTSFETLFEEAKILEVDVRKLIVSTLDF